MWGIDCPSKLGRKSMFHKNWLERAKWSKRPLCAEQGLSGLGVFTLHLLEILPEGLGARIYEHMRLTIDLSLPISSAPLHPLYSGRPIQPNPAMRFHFYMEALSLYLGSCYVISSPLSYYENDVRRG